MGRFHELEPSLFFFVMAMKRKTKIPENIWNIICTAAIIACLVLAAVAFFK